MFLKNVSYSHQGRICLIKYSKNNNIVKYQNLKYFLNNLNKMY